jgi:hypothetical protein
MELAKLAGVLVFCAACLYIAAVSAWIAIAITVIFALALTVILVRK